MLKPNSEQRRRVADLPQSKWIEQEHVSGGQQREDKGTADDYPLSRSRLTDAQCYGQPRAEARSAGEAESECAGQGASAGMHRGVRLALRSPLFRRPRSRNPSNSLWSAPRGLHEPLFTGARSIAPKSNCVVSVSETLMPRSQAGRSRHDRKRDDCATIRSGTLAPQSEGGRPRHDHTWDARATISRLAIPASFS